MKKQTKPKAKKRPAATRQRVTATDVVAATVLLLKCVGPNGEAHGSFVWPLEVGVTVTAPDWSPTPQCGRGLHAWLWGEGDSGTASHRDNERARWLVLEAPADPLVDLQGKVKVPAAKIVFIGDAKAAALFLQSDPRAAGKRVIHGTATAGYSGTATAGDRGTATAGDRGTATAGYRGTATAGDRGTVSLIFWDEKRNTYRRRIAEVVAEDEEPEANQCRPGVPYRCDESGKIVVDDRVADAITQGLRAMVGK